ncbi:unnamed protein product [Cuscuta campestris]|uniref:Uncharacterized protein n=1 Tax=Cuscuta campestris TaxID=132261 RepID=A0A484NCL7_9ASTE|nr:unnamed protein product [Cuscuta campestris]
MNPSPSSSNTLNASARSLSSCELVASPPHRSEEDVVERPVECVEVFESETAISWFDERPDRGLHLGDICVEAEEVERLAELVDGDHAVAVPIEEVEDPSETDGVEARTAQPE